MTRRSALWLLCGAIIASAPLLPSRAEGGDTVAAAKKELREYKARFEKMKKEKGIAKACEIFLTPDYTLVSPGGEIITRADYITGITTGNTHVAPASALEAKAQPHSAPYMVGKPVETISVAGNQVVVTTTATTVQDRKHSPGAFIAASRENERRYTQTNRATYLRTPDGLRLQRDQNIAMKRLFDGKPHPPAAAAVAPPVPAVPATPPPGETPHP